MVVVLLCVATGSIVAADNNAAAGIITAAGSIACGTGRIAWPNGIERHYESGRLHREEGPAVVIKGSFEAWYQRGARIASERTHTSKSKIAYTCQKSNIY
jgi:hypothetical protein